MGEYADMMLDGTMCQGCGEYIGSDNGFPTFCKGCAREDRKANPALYAAPKNPAKVACKVCGRHVKQTGLNDHMRDKHSQGNGEQQS